MNQNESIPEPTLYRQQFYKQPVVLVDGITRTGKTMFCPVLTSFEGVELQRIESIFDRVPRLYMLNKLKKDAAIAFLRLETQMKLYESMISRNINFRRGDYSGVFNQINSWRYIKRIFAKEGDCVVKKILEEKPIFQIQVHDVLGMSEIYFDAFKDNLRIIEMLRHPIDSIHGNYRRGYGKRENNDSRIFDFNILYEKKLVPWYCYGWEKEYLSCTTPIDKVIKMYAFRLKKMWAGYDQLTTEQKKKILFVSFDGFATNPKPYIQKIEEFIGRKKTKYTQKALKKSRCPRVLNEEDRKKKEKDIRETASEECIKIMEELIQEYEKRIKTLWFSNL
jgi:hypothetical protein